MRRNLPSPTALLAFEASARLLSFKRAAEELNVSPAAVSRQIRNLEDYVGVPLFRRLHRRVALTEAGERLSDPVSQGFAGMAAALAGLKTDGGERQVTVGTTVGFAFYWLMPRLARFSEAWPEITLNQIVADEPIDLSDGRADLAVRYGAGRWPGLESRPLFGDRVYPVCSPSYLENTGRPAAVADLAEHPLIESHGIAGDRWLDWTAWFRHVGHRATGMRRRYLNYHIGVQLALDGQGYALGWHSFVGPLVADGRLVKPLDAEVSSPGGFFLTSSAGRTLSSDARLFADWLIAEASEP
jgi:DNA-binding transcriptional LysR family regulator